MKNRKMQLILWITLIFNVILSIIKLTAGYRYHSPSLTTDGFNSFFDVFISVMLIIMTRTSNRAPDANHHYGHQKYEGLAFFALGLLITFTTILLGYNNVVNFVVFLKEGVHIAATWPALIVAIISVLIKVFLVTFNYAAFKKLKRPSLKGDALNHLGDIFATSVSIVSIVLTFFNFFYFEYIGTFIIVLIILYSSFQIIKEAAYYLTDASPSAKRVASIKEEILDVDGVLSVDDLKVRRHMNYYYVDVEIGVEHTLSLEAAHQISENVHERVESKFKVLHCHVHVNPFHENLSIKLNI